MTAVITAIEIQVEPFSYSGLQLIDQLLTNGIKGLGSMTR